MSFIKEIDLTIFGQQITGIKIPVGCTVNWVLDCQDPITREPLDLDGAAVIMTLKALDVQGNPAGVALISRQATINDAVNGICTVPWASGDTAPSGAPLKPNLYGIDVWVEDVDGNRIQELLFAPIELTPASRLPDDPITPLPEQQPLAQGPQGPPGADGILGLPDQASHAGEFLQTDGANLSWATVDALPAQSGHTGQFLETDGSSASWATPPATTHVTMGGDINGESNSAQVAAIQTIPVVDMSFELPPNDHQALVYANGNSRFEPANIVNSISAGGGIKLNNVVQSNVTGTGIAIAIDGSALALTPQAGALPTADAGNYGKFYFLQGGGPDGEDQVFICLRDATSTYVWVLWGAAI